MKSVYLDYAAATPLDNAVLEAMQPYWTEKFYNPSAVYMAAKGVSGDITAARATVAEILGVRPAELVFVPGGTEANNLAIHGVMRQYPDGNCVVSAIEHDSVRAVVSGYDYRELPVTPGGIVALDQVASKIDDQTVLVSVMYVNNEIGTIQPLKEIAKLLQKVRQQRVQDGNKTPLYFHTDACQAGNYLPLLAHSLGVDMMTINGGKVYGPKQSAVLYVKTGVTLRPLVRGGGQEWGLRSGTENVPAIIGLATALKRAQSVRQEETERLATLQRDTLLKLVQAIPQVVINGGVLKDDMALLTPEQRVKAAVSNRVANNIHLTVPGYDNERLVMELDEKGILVATGSACSASSDEPSHVLKALGLPLSAIQSSIRMTMGRQTTAEDMAYVVQALAERIH